MTRDAQEHVTTQATSGSPHGATFGRAAALHRQGKLAEARRLYEDVLSDEPDHSDALHFLGLIMHQTRDPEKAIALISRSIALTPLVPFAYNNRGVALKALRRYDEALADYEKAIELKPDYADAFHNRANILKELGRLEDAQASYSRAIELQPDNPRIYNDRGNVLSQLKRYPEAIIAYAMAIRLNPDFAEAYNNRGNALQELDRLQEALQDYQKGLELQPSSAEIRNNLGNTLFKLERYEEALASYQSALKLKPHFPDAHNNTGMALARLYRFEESLSSFEQAVAQKPSYAEAYSNRGLILQEIGRASEAMEQFRKAISLNPSFTDAYTHMSFAQLLTGDLPSGFRNYEYRKVSAKPAGHRKFPKPAWLGETPLAGRRLLVHHEQGLGDTILFCRFLEQLQGGGKVLFAPQPQLKALMSTLQPPVEIVDLSDDTLDFDIHVPLLSLPLACRTSLDTIPAHVPYLFADPARIGAWQRRLGENGFRVGINWQGKKSDIDLGRSFPVSEFLPLSRIPGVRLISLHKGAGEAQLSALPPGMTVETLGSNFDSGSDAFLDTAAVMKCCHLVITSDTATAHLAGALGVPVWLAIKCVPEWRWFLNRKDSPWYPTMRLFRQKTHGAWKGVFETIHAELGELVERTLPAGRAVPEHLAPDIRPALATPEVPVSWGELIDKLTILKIKVERLPPGNGRENVRRELKLLAARAEPAFQSSGGLDNLVERLSAVNVALWEIEDRIREKEAADTFDADFIALARAVYKNNDERARLKREINTLLASELIEEKSYASYKA